jgi:diaminopimelate decarboxylase
MLRDFLKEKKEIESPAYYFDLDVFAKRVNMVKEKLPNIPLTFSIKANPFLLTKLPENLCHVEVCSPGELKICKKYGIPGDKIIYSGVNKEMTDVSEAVEYEVDIATAESMFHVQLEQQAAAALGKKQKVILRLTSGNQFGMSEEDICQILSHAQDYPNLVFYGIHYYSGTQKKLRQVEKDLARLDSFLEKLKTSLDFAPNLVEVGPGLSVNYFNPPYDEGEVNGFDEVVPLLLEFAQKYPMGIEMGRFLAASCGIYATKVMDIKKNSDTNYIICDGGIHHLRYHGQTMAMQVPEMDVIMENEERDRISYCICGSLCTVADVLVRDVELPKMKRGDVLLFCRCGAYSVTEGSALFLSRQIPSVYLYGEDCGLIRGRNCMEVADFL